jgi:hypothetical protein
VPQDVILFGEPSEKYCLWKSNATEEEILLLQNKPNAYNFIESFPENLKRLWEKEELNFSATETTTYCHLALLEKPKYFDSG